MKDWPFSRLIAHRGGGTLAPENTLAAFRLGQSLGYRSHELDVKLSRDGELILLHDPTLERTTNGSGRAADLDWCELRKLDAGSWHSEAFRGEPLPRFDEAAKLLIDGGSRVVIEIKATPGFDAITARRVAERTRELWRSVSPKPVFCSFSFESMLAAREVAPELPRLWLVSQFTDADWERLEAIEAVGLSTNYRKLDLRHLPRLHDSGYRVIVYTCNDAGTVESLVGGGIDGIVTDNLAELAQRFPDWI